MKFASWGPRGNAFGSLLGPLGAILGVLERSCGILDPSCIILGFSWGSLGGLVALLGTLGDVLEPCWCAPGALRGTCSGVAQELLGVLFVGGPPGAAPRARTRNTVNQLPEILARPGPLGRRI